MKITSIFHDDLDVLLVFENKERCFLRKLNLSKVANWRKETLLRSLANQRLFKNLKSSSHVVFCSELKGMKTDWEYSSPEELIDLLKGYAIASEL